MTTPICDLQHLTSLASSAVQARWDLAQQVLQVTQATWQTTPPPFIAKLMSDNDWQELDRAAEQLGKFSTVLVVGIGGSSLGLRALLDAVAPLGSATRVIPCDSLDPDVLAQLFAELDWKTTGINIVSKSGGTLEIMALASVLVVHLREKLPQQWQSHVVITTDPISGSLRHWANQEQLTTCCINPEIGGRFSVLTAVGLLPAQLAGVDVRALVQGARVAAAQALDIADCPALQLAAWHCAFDLADDRSICVSMPYTTRLAEFSRWFVQLWAESLGKEGKGQTPIAAVGTADQHAQLQLFMQGPPNKMLRFYTVKKWQSDLKITKPLLADALFLQGQTLGNLLMTAATATAQALAEVKCPSYTWCLNSLNAETLGYLLMSDMIQTVAAGQCYAVNPYGQPGVELGKKLWREALRA